MHQDGADAGNLGCLNGTEYCVSQEGWAERLALNCLINRKPPDHHHRHGIRHIASDSAWRLSMSDSTRGESVIGNDPLSLASDVCPRGTALFVLKCPLPQPVIERRFTAVELR